MCNTDISININLGNRGRRGRRRREEEEGGM